MLQTRTYSTWEITPMTEAPFMLFFVGGAYYFMRWMSGSGNYPSLQLSNRTRRSRDNYACPKQVGGGNSAQTFPCFQI